MVLLLSKCWLKTATEIVSSQHPTSSYLIYDVCSPSQNAPSGLGKHFTASTEPGLPFSFFFSLLCTLQHVSDMHMKQALQLVCGHTPLLTFQLQQIVSISLCDKLITKNTQRYHPSAIISIPDPIPIAPDLTTHIFPIIH